MKRAVIVSSGHIYDYDFYKDKIQKNDYIICADGGIKHLKKLNIKPDIFFGDFDSCNYTEVVNNGLLNDVTVNKFDCIDKNETDTQIAIEHALNEGYKDILLMGVLGSRIDHSLINIFQLKYIHDKGARGKILNENNEIVLIDKEISLVKDSGYYLSLISFTDIVEGITTSGLKYPLYNYTLLKTRSRGISNEFTDDSDIAGVTIKSGLLLVIKSKD